jgi:hypothetical protein
MKRPSLNLNLVIAIAVCLIYLVFSIWSSRTKSPWSDEAWFANAAFNLATKGRLTTTVLETQGTNLHGLDQHTYWVMPLHLLVQAFWYKIAGFSLLNMRLISVAFGLLALWAWFVVVSKLLGNKEIALLTIVILSSDYFFLMGASFGRMDMMSMALGASALAVYLILREKNLGWAVISSQSLIVASGLTHPNGGVIFLLGWIFLAIYLDRKRLRVKYILPFVIPYLVGAALWGAYILQAPDLFWSQFVTNASMGGRMSGFASPLAALKNEIVLRYIQSYGLAGHSVGNSGPIRLKALILVAYIIGICGILLTRSLRRNSGCRALLLLTALFFLILTIVDGQKLSFYLIHIVPLYSALLAVWIHWCWTTRRVPRFIVAGLVFGFLALQLGGVAYRAKQNSYRTSYLPAVDFIRTNFDSRDSIMGSAVLGFSLGFDRIIDDVRLGFISGKRSKLIVVGETYEGAFKDYEKNEPEIYRHILNLTTNTYRPVYSGGTYQIYVLNSAADQNQLPRQ